MSRTLPAEPELEVLTRGMSGSAPDRQVDYREDEHGYAECENRVKRRTPLAPDRDSGSRVRAVMPRG